MPVHIRCQIVICLLQMTAWDDVRAKPCIFKSTAQVLNHTTMAPSITSAFASFLQSLSGIGVSILGAVIGVLYAFLALGQTLFASVVQLGQSVLKRECKYLDIRSLSLMCRIVGMDVFQGVFGFVAGTSPPWHTDELNATNWIPQPTSLYSLFLVEDITGIPRTRRSGSAGRNASADGLRKS